MSEGCHFKLIKKPSFKCEMDDLPCGKSGSVPMIRSIRSTAKVCRRLCRSRPRLIRLFGFYELKGFCRICYRTGESGFAFFPGGERSSTSEISFNRIPILAQNAANLKAMHAEKNGSPFRHGLLARPGFQPESCPRWWVRSVADPILDKGN